MSRVTKRVEEAMQASSSRASSRATSSAMRRSKSAGDKFVFGARRRTLTPVQNARNAARAAELAGQSPGPNQLTSPRPNKKPSDGQYWKSHYNLSDYKNQYPQQFEQNQFDEFYSWIKQSDKNKNLDSEIAAIMRILFARSNN